MYLRQR